MNLFGIANYRFVKGILVNANVLFADDEPDVLALSNPQEHPVFVSFYNPDNLPLTIDGAAFGSLQLAPKGFAVLVVDDGNITVKAGAIDQIPLVPSGELNPAIMVDYKTEYDTKLDNKKGTYQKGKQIWNQEQAKLQGYL